MGIKTENPKEDLNDLAKELNVEDVKGRIKEYLQEISKLIPCLNEKESEDHLPRLDMDAELDRINKSDLSKLGIGVKSDAGRCRLPRRRSASLRRTASGWSHTGHRA